MDHNVALCPSTHTLCLDKPPCSIVFLPDQQDYFVVGTYNLVSDVETSAEGDGHKQQRDGSLILCRIAQDKTEIVETAPTEFGVLDLRFSPLSTILAAATSTGSIALYTVTTSEHPFHLSCVRILQVADHSVVVTSLSFNPKVTHAQVFATLSTGTVSAIRLPHDLSSSNPDILEETDTTTVYKHALEAWICSASLGPTVTEQNSAKSSTLVISGGDDAVLHISSGLLAEEKVEADAKLEADWTTTWTDRRTHSAGITAILPLSIPPLAAKDAHLLLTGSYDDKLRLLRIPGRPGTRTEVLAELDLGGGVWSLKILDEIDCHQIGAENFSATMRILVSCMYAGAFVVTMTLHLNQSSEDDKFHLSGEFSVLARFVEHESMCYAAVPIPEQPHEYSMERLAVSCSFYDKRLCLWKFRDAAQASIL